MSFLSELKKQKNKLKVIETVVTNADGQRYVERGGEMTLLSPNPYGFIVDTKPDNIPVQVVDNLYIGSQDCAVTDVIKVYNITNIFSVGIEAEVPRVNRMFVQCLDLPETDIKLVLAECLPFIRRAVDCRQNVLVHCNAGVSRTSMVAIGYLMQYHEMSFNDAYALVKEKRPAIQPNDGFKKQLKMMKPGQII